MGAVIACVAAWVLCVGTGLLVTIWLAIMFGLVSLS
jgi:hypothetical protein